MSEERTKQSARLSSVVTALNAANQWTPADHPALTREEIAEDMAALIAAASRVYRETQFQIGPDAALRYSEAYAWADLKLRQLREWCDDGRP